MYYRSEPVTPAFAIVERVRFDEAIAWWMAAFGELHEALPGTGVERTGPDGTLFPTEFFEADTGELVAYLPASGAPPTGGRIVRYDIPAAELAVTMHRGPFGDLDRTYGALGTWVMEQAESAAGPIRERYLPLADDGDLLNHETEVCWPVTRPTAE